MLDGVAPGWYAVPFQKRNLLNRLSDASFEIWYSFAYHYVCVTVANRAKFRELARSERVYRISDVEAHRVVNSAMARAAVNRHPGSRLDGKFTEEDVLGFLRSQGERCAACGTGISCSYTIDHIVPRSRGGSNDPTNIQLLCGPCNSSKSDRTMNEWLAATGRRPVITVRAGQYTVSAKFHTEAVTFTEWLFRAHDSRYFLQYELATVQFKRFYEPELTSEIAVYPALLCGEATCGSDRIMWQVAPNRDRFVFMRPLGRGRDSGLRVVTAYRQGESALTSFLRSTGLREDGDPAPWVLRRSLPPELSGGPLRSRIDVLPLR